MLSQIQQELQFEINSVSSIYQNKYFSLTKRYKEQHEIINQLKEEDLKSLQIKVSALFSINQIENQLETIQDNYQVELSKIRYRKGLELIKIMYEKILGLDHHFTSLKTFQNISTLSNPNSFPEFEKTRDILGKRLNKKQAVNLPSLLETNPFVSMTFSLVSSFVGGGDRKNREEDLEKIACILDFTVRMNADLNIVYYETEYLKESNDALKLECINLFKDYTKVVGYKIPLNECRKDDDWETILIQLDEYVASLAEKNSSNKLIAYKQQVNLEFSIDRLLQFMNKYSSFISQGEQYYQKFNTILNNYENEDVCQNQMPHLFTELKDDVKQSILKFNEAYNISELHGSKLKDLMYGVTEGYFNNNK
ncbi:MAG: hypothetical protein AB8H03_01160 [Saprospiraceae bacterium]